MNAIYTPENLTDRVRSAVFWRSGSQIVAQIVMWASTVIVVRLLDPQDYGLFAMTQVVLVLFNFLNGYSFASSLVQTESIDDRQVAQVFGLLIVLNCGLALAQLIAAPVVAAYFNQPIVGTMLRVQAVLYIATPFIALPSALLSRTLDFRKQAKANLASALSGATTALACAWAGFGVWTLVVTPIVMFAVRAVALTMVARLLIRPSFDFRGSKAMMRFGGALMLCQFFWIVQSQADIFLAGRRFDPHNLGLYAEALFLTQIFTGKFVPPLNEVAFPSYAQLAKDGGAVGPAFLKVVRLTMLVAMPLYLGMAVVAEPFVATLFGSKWMEMVPLVRVLALAMPFFTLQIIFSPVTNALGRPSVYVATSAAGAIIMPLAFLLGVRGGLHGLTQAWLVAAPLLLVVTAGVSLPHIGVSWGALGRAIAPSLAAALAMMAIVTCAMRLVATMPAPVQLGLLGMLGAATYFALLRLLAHATLSELWRLIARREIVPAS